MFTAVLSVLVLGCLLYGRLPLPALAPLCAGAGVFLYLFSRRGRAQPIDVLVQTSRFLPVNSALKVWAAAVWLVLCVASPGAATGFFMALAMFFLTVALGKIKWRDYLRLLALPATFLLLSGLVLLLEVSVAPSGVLCVPLFGRYICVTPAAQAQAGLVMARAFGAVSCLYFLSLSTPMPALIGVLKSVRVPQVVISLMYLIYRYINILLDMHGIMRDAAKSRLGYADYRTALRTTGRIYSHLLARSYRQAGQNYDAMESRCFEGSIRFIERRSAVRPLHLAVAVCIGGAALAITVWQW